MQKMYKGLENKIISLQQRIDDLNRDNNQLKQKNAEIPELKTKLEQMRLLDIEVKAMRIQIIGKTSSLEVMTKQFDTERDEKMSILDEKIRDEKQWKLQKQALLAETGELKVQLNKLVEDAKKEAIGMLSNDYHTVFSNYSYFY